MTNAYIKKWYQESTLLIDFTGNIQVIDFTGTIQVAVVVYIILDNLL